MYLHIVDIFDTWHLSGKITLMILPVTDILVIIKVHILFAYPKSRDNSVGIVTRLWA
jgi:hypothetical protein